MIRRPNVRARCFQHNLRARSPRNRHYLSRPHKLYLYGRFCRWCRREYYLTYFDAFPKLCRGCAQYLIDFWNDHTIALTTDGLHHPTKILKL